MARSGSYHHYALDEQRHCFRCKYVLCTLQFCEPLSSLYISDAVRVPLICSRSPSWGQLLFQAVQCFSIVLCWLNLNLDDIVWCPFTMFLNVLLSWPNWAVDTADAWYDKSPNHTASLMLVFSLHLCHQAWTEFKFVFSFDFSLAGLCVLSYTYSELLE